MTEDNVEKMLEELKSKNLINRNIKIKKSLATPNFQASIFRRWLIKYNSAFSNLSEDTLKFVILHEVAHKQEKIYKREIVSVFLSLFFSTTSLPISHLILGFSFLFKSLIFSTLSLIFAFILPFYVFVFTFRLLAPWLSQDEFDADIWATKQLLKAYKIKNLREYVGRVFNEIASFSQKMRLRRNILGRLQGFFLLLFPYHPSSEERILNIVSFFSNEGDKDINCLEGEKVLK